MYYKIHEFSLPLWDEVPGSKTSFDKSIIFDGKKYETLNL